MDIRLDSVCSIYTLINTQRIRLDGTARLYIRITIKGEDTKIPLPFYWPVLFFNKKNKVIEPRSTDDPDYLTFLSAIESEKAKYWNVAKKLILKDVNFTLDDILSGVLLAESTHSIVKWMIYKSALQLKDGKIKRRTANLHKASAKHVLEYQKKDIKISDIDTKWLSNYMAWLLKDMAYGGAWNRIKDVKSYVRLARDAGESINPDFDNHYLPKPTSNPIWLTKEELKMLFDYLQSPEISPENYDCIISFLFACFTGLRISDLKRFDSSWIQDEEIVFTPTKKKITDKSITVLRIPLIPVAKEFLGTLDGKTLVRRSEQKFNERLKSIAEIVGIKKKITTHVARHTFATALAILNVPITVISSLLGHKTLASTLIYIHIAEEIKKKEMNKLQSEFGGFSLKLA